jgi:mono/diheme cytochrome c family protein
MKILSAVLATVVASLLASGADESLDRGSSETKIDTLPASVLAWVGDQKEYVAKKGEAAIDFRFEATNVSGREVVITKVVPSCGCTVVKLPLLPWILPAGERAIIPLTVDLRGKSGTLAKEVTVHTSQGSKVLHFKIEIPPGAPFTSPVAEFRERNLAVAAGDPQAIFKDTCANCHAKPARGKLAGELYQAACAICHNSPNRAQMVPALDVLPHPTDFDFWKQIIIAGKPGTLMPPFGTDKGGPLTEEQVVSLARFLATTISGQQE